MKRHRFSFTVWEHLIAAVAAAIVLTLVAPPMMRSQVCLNEAKACETLAAIAEAQARFQSSAVRDDNGDGIGDYATLEQLAGDNGADAYLSAVLRNGTRGGYRFDIEVTPGSREHPASFFCQARPLQPKLTGWHTYIVDSSGIVVCALDAAAEFQSASLLAR